MTTKRSQSAFLSTRLVGRGDRQEAQLIRRDLDIRCAGASRLVDVMTKLNVGDFIRVSSVSAPKGTEIIAPNDFNILTVIGKRGAVVEGEDSR